MPNELNANSKTERLGSIFGSQIAAYVDRNLKIIKNVSLSPEAKDEKGNTEVVELFVALEDTNLRSEIVNDIVNYGIKFCAFAYGSATTYPNYRTAAVDATVFQRTIEEFLTPYQCLLLAQNMLKTKNEQAKKGQTR